MIAGPARARSLAGACATALVATLALAAGGPVLAQSPGDEHAHHHHHEMQPEALRRSVAEILVPDVELVRHDGARVALRGEVEDGRPVFLDFMYTTCTAICPVTTATFAALQERLGAAREAVHMVSISIDPEEDTPVRLVAYRKKYAAGTQWGHYTGAAEASVAVQRAFGAFTGDKMGHQPVTFFRPAPGQPWVRLDGFATPEDLYGEVKALLPAP
jgi:protein SCO1/2